MLYSMPNALLLMVLLYVGGGGSGGIHPDKLNYSIFTCVKIRCRKHRCTTCEWQARAL